jgi:hypothetical protein
MGTDQNWAWIGSGTGFQTASSERTRAGRYPLWMWWNLLSLDAPTVVCVWALFFTHILHIPSPFLDTLVLTVAVWLIYVSDRVLDGLRPSRGGEHSDRHDFYARHSYAVLGALLPPACAIFWVCLTCLNSQTRAAGLVICGAVGFYFLTVHGVPDRVMRWFPKELFAGAIFAAGAAIPAWTHAGESRKGFIPAVLLFAGLCGLNCIAIECWEHHRGERQWEKRPYWLIRLADSRIVEIAAVFLVCAAFLGTFGPHDKGQMELVAASGVSLSLLAALDWRSNDLSPQILRVLADAVLLTPALFLLKSVL